MDDVLDVDAMRADLQVEEDRAFAIADELAAATYEKRSASETESLATRFVEARTHCRRLRNAIKATVEG